MWSRTGYYALKPFLPWWLRVRLRRVRARFLKWKCGNSWPICTDHGQPPEGWRGWPDGKQFAFVLTHDVESLKGVERSLALGDLDRRFGFRSAFYFVPEGTYLVPDLTRRSLEAQDLEVGVHDLHHDGRLFSSATAFEGRAVRINTYLKNWDAVGFRSAFMLHELDWLGDLDVLYDASTFDFDPFEPQPDGVSTIFPFNVTTSKGRTYVELPYTLPQDFTLFVLFRERTIDTWKRKLDWVARQGGMALVNVHPDYLGLEGSCGPDEFPVRIYEDLLRYVRESYGDVCWFAQPREVALYVQQNYSLPARSPGLTRRFAAERMRGVTPGGLVRTSKL